MNNDDIAKLLGETKSQESASGLPLPSSEYPGPWTTHGRGNGHIDVFDANGKYIAHVYCWDEKDWDTLDAAVERSKLPPNE